jgi:hypothetical protein
METFWPEMDTKKKKYMNLTPWAPDDIAHKDREIAIAIMKRVQSMKHSTVCILL